MVKLSDEERFFVRSFLRDLCDADLRAMDGRVGGPADVVTVGDCAALYELAGED